MEGSDKLANRGYQKVSLGRELFWAYCGRAVNSAQNRARKRGVPCTIDEHEIDRLLVDQKWCCAVSGIPLDAPNGQPTPFGPSLDRIKPELGYVPGNVRVVCNLVNAAMNQWGEEPLYRLVRVLKGEV